MTRRRRTGQDFPVRILLATAGSRGDVEPFVALGVRARAEGHEVRLVAPENSGADTDDLDVDSMGVDISRIIEDQGVSLLAALRSYRTVMRPLMRRIIVGSARVALDYRPDVIVYHPKVMSAPLVADALGVPHVLVEIVPVLTPTRAFPAAGTVPRSIGPFNRLTYRTERVASKVFRADLAEVRAMVGAPNHTPSAPATILMPISPAILARPDDWPESVHLTGPWVRSSRPAALGPEVAEFIGRGPFMYAGFGSMVAGDATARGCAIVDAARARGIRCLAATGLGGIDLPANARGADVLVVRSVPHAAVLARATTAVHHGGIGTVQAAMAAATPSVIVPFIADQPFWGARLHEWGLAPPPIKQRALTVSALVTALGDAERYRPRVGQVAKQMAAEDGTGAALAVLTGFPGALPRTGR
jgi:sterol 3beta-glucosyltransferase